MEEVTLWRRNFSPIDASVVDVSDNIKRSFPPDIFNNSINILRKREGGGGGGILHFKSTVHPALALRGFASHIFLVYFGRGRVGSYSREGIYNSVGLYEGKCSI